MTTISISIPVASLSRLKAFIKKEGGTILAEESLENNTLSPIQQKVQQKWNEYEMEKGSPLTAEEKEDLTYGIMMEESNTQPKLTESESKELIQRLLKSAK